MSGQGGIRLIKDFSGYDLMVKCGQWWSTVVTDGQRRSRISKGVKSGQRRSRWVFKGSPA